MTNERARILADDALNRLTELLDQGHSATLTAYLATLARFHRYSFGNVLLTHFQRPDATRVAGFDTWRKLGRMVRRGRMGSASSPSASTAPRAAAARRTRRRRSRTSGRRAAFGWSTCST